MTEEAVTAAEDSLGTEITPELVAKATGAKKVLRPKLKQPSMFSSGHDIFEMIQMLAENQQHPALNNYRPGGASSGASRRAAQEVVEPDSSLV